MPRCPADPSLDRPRAVGASARASALDDCPPRAGRAAESVPAEEARLETTKRLGRALGAAGLGRAGLAGAEEAVDLGRADLGAAGLAGGGTGTDAGLGGSGTANESTSSPARAFRLARRSFR